MRHPPSLRARRNGRLIALLIAVLALGVVGVLYGGNGDSRTATTALGPGWNCKPNMFGTVCVRDETQTAAKR